MDASLFWGIGKRTTTLVFVILGPIPYLDEIVKITVLVLVISLYYVIHVHIVEIDSVLLN